MFESLLGTQGSGMPVLGYTGPGRQYPKIGDKVSGYFEELTTEDFTTITDVVELTGLSIAITDPDVTWLKFYYGDKVLFTTKKPIGVMSWNALYRNGSLYGSGDEGEIPEENPVLQYKEVRVKGDYFKVRVLRGSIINPYMESESVFQSEYDSTMMKVSQVLYPGRGNKKWEMFTLASIGGGANELVLEHASSDMNLVIHRNLTNGAVGTIGKGANVAYRPVLELVKEPLRPILYLSNCNYSILQKDIDEFVDTSVVGNIRTNYAITQKDLSDHIDVASAINIRTNYSIRLFDLE